METKTLLNRINENAILDMNVTFEDVLGKGRFAFVFSGGEKIREELTEISGPLLIVNRRLFGTNITAIQTKYAFESEKYDCREWAFDQIGLPQYTRREKGGRSPNRLLLADLPELRWTDSPKKGSLVLYFSLPFDPDKLLTKETSVEHWGVVCDTESSIGVGSKWGEHHVYAHPLELLPHIYGQCAMFFDKVA